MALNYNYDDAKAYCQSIGLHWLGDDYGGLIDSDHVAKSQGLTQEQVNALMRCHLWQTKTVLTPKNYKFLQCIKIALYFIVGWKPS